MGGTSTRPVIENPTQVKFTKINIMTQDTTHKTPLTPAEALRALIKEEEKHLPHAETEYVYCEIQGFINGVKVALQILGA